MDIIIKTKEVQTEGGQGVHHHNTKFQQDKLRKLKPIRPALPKNRYHIIQNTQRILTFPIWDMMVFELH